MNFDLVTLNMYHVLRYALRYFTQSLNSVKFMKCDDFFTLIRHAMTLTFDPLTLKVLVDPVARGHSLY